MGHPFGPTGLGQNPAIFWQLRGEAGTRQILNPKPTGLAHMIGLGGTCIAQIFQR
jgi:acetyl-CoA acetyltransferase